MADQKSKTRESENRDHDSRPLATEAREGAPMDRSIQAHNQPYVYRPNGFDGHDFEVTVSAWWQAWTMAKPFVSGAVVFIAVAVWYFLHSVWFNGPVPASQLAEVTSKQSVTNVELKASIEDLTRTSRSHDRILEKLAGAIGEVRNDVAFIRGAFSAVPVQAYSPPSSPTLPFTHPRTRSQPAAWQARPE
jgi:hypothetical protein